MKFLILLSLLLNSYAFAITCEDIISEVDDSAELQHLSDSSHLVEEMEGPLFSESLMETPVVLDVVGEFEATRCETALRQTRITAKGKEFNFIYTNEDECDGGNSYGYIADSENKVLGFITDSFLECL